MTVYSLKSLWIHLALVALATTQLAQGRSSQTPSLGEFSGKVSPQLNKLAGLSGGQPLPLTLSAAKTEWFVDWYSKLLDKLIDKLSSWIDDLDDPSPDVLDRIACANGFNVFLRHVSSSWALNMIDSATKLQSGLLTGNLVDMGQFDECIDVQVEADRNDNFTTSFTGQHCLVSFNIHVPNNTLVLNGEENKLIDLFGVEWIPLTVSQCFPSLCKSYHLQEIINDILSNPDYVLEIFGIQYSIDVTIASTDCHVKGYGHIDTLDWIVAGIVFAILFINGLCTSFDYFYIARQTRLRQPKAVENVILGFSIYTNCKKLINTNLSSDAMTALNGMKFYSICWVVLCHRYRFLINQPIINLLDFPKELKDIAKMIILSGPLSVDTFFLISGLLNMYTFCMIRDKNRKFNIFEPIVHLFYRYFRLTPAYLMMIAFTSTWLYHIGNGPFWDRLVGYNRDNCRQNYWMNLIYLNNYLEPDNYCMMQSWYLAADMQMSALAPFVVIPLWKWPVLGFIMLAVLIVASILSPMLISFFYAIKAPIPLTTDPVIASHEMAWLYLPTHTKTLTYIIGILTGYLAYLCKTSKVRFAPNKVTQAFFWAVSLVFMAYAIFGGYPLYQRDVDYNKIYSAFYIGLFRFFWGVGLMWIIFACVSGYGGPINTFLSWSALTPLARLSYCVYLTHIAVILRGIGTHRTPTFFSDYDQVHGFLGDLVLSFIAAAFLSILVEAPMMKMGAFMFQGGLRKKPAPRAPPAEHHVHSA